ncbi:MAG: ribosome-associated translation inhibitor RaiA [Magnetococcales bacterium]|nr:ribosome-associated translation inhibitor RaiA [Magnetococcales bacterium]
MEIKFEGRQVDLGDELRQRVQKRFDSLDKRFGPITHARLSVEKMAHKNEQRAVVKAIVNIAGNTLTATRDAPTVMNAVNDTLDTLTQELQTYVEKKNKEHRH